MAGIELARIVLISIDGANPFAAAGSESANGRCMELPRHLGNDWRNAIWKLVRNPALEVVAAIVVVLFAAWLLVSIEMDEKRTLFPVPYGAHR
jgi:hypothetical protein